MAKLRWKRCTAARIDVRFVEFDTFRAELRSIDQAVANVTAKTVRDEALKERCRTLFRVWVSAVQPSVASHVQTARDFFKLNAELERLAQLTSKTKTVAEYRKRLRAAEQLANSIVLLLPAETPQKQSSGAADLFLAGIPDLPTAFVPNAIVGWRSSLEAFVDEHPFDRSVFIMIRYRTRTQPIINAIKGALEDQALFGVVASEHRITDDLYNPIACLLGCARGIAVFDEPEADQTHNPNVAYELGMLHLLGRQCLILKDDQLRTLQTDILMKLYVPFTGAAGAAECVESWCSPA